MFDYESKIQHWVNRLSFLLRSEVHNGFKQGGIDLSAEEWALLLVLWQKGPQQMGPLAALTLRDRTTVTRLVDRLVKKGFVQRSGGETDRRQVMVSISKEGSAAREHIVGAVLPVIEKSDQNISLKEKEIALKVLKQMVENLGKS